MLLNDSCCSSSPSRLTTVSDERFAIIAFATRSLVDAQISITLLYRSPAVTRPDWYCSWISRTSSSASAISVYLAGGTTISSIPTDTPDSAAYAKPVYMIWSAKITVSFRPSLRYASFSRLEICFLPSFWLTMLYGRPAGTICHSIARPIVVSTILVSVVLLPSSSTTVSVIRTLTRA